MLLLYNFVFHRPKSRSKCVDFPFIERTSDDLSKNVKKVIIPPGLYNDVEIYKMFRKFVEDGLKPDCTVYVVSPFLKAKSDFDIDAVIHLIATLLNSTLKREFDDIVARIKKFIDAVTPQINPETKPSDEEVEEIRNEICNLRRIKFYTRVSEFQAIPEQLRNILKVKWTIMLQKKGKSFHCKWAAIEHLDQEDVKLFLTSANLTSDHMNKSKRGDLNQCESLFVAEITKEEFDTGFVQKM